MAIFKVLCDIQQDVKISEKTSSLKKAKTWTSCFVCFVALRPKSTAMDIAGRSVHLTTLLTNSLFNRNDKTDKIIKKQRKKYLKICIIYFYIL